MGYPPPYGSVCLAFTNAIFRRFESNPPAIILDLDDVSSGVSENFPIASEHEWFLLPFVGPSTGSVTEYPPSTDARHYAFVGESRKSGMGVGASSEVCFSRSELS